MIQLQQNEIYGPLDDILDDDEVKGNLFKNECRHVHHLSNYSYAAPDMFSDDTSCTICSGIFRDPRILNCGHTFCLKCLVRMHRHSRQAVLICPICREETIVYSSDLKYLTKNFVVKNLVETIKLSSKNGEFLSMLTFFCIFSTIIFGTKYILFSLIC